MTLEQQRAIAVARARLRLQQQAAPAEPVPAQPDEVDLMAGSPAARFALGAAAPVLGAAQLGAEAIGFKGISEQLKRVDEMKKRGMTPAADLKRLEEGRAIMSTLPGYEATVANIDKQIAELKASGASADPSQAGFDLAGTVGTILSPVALGAMKIAPAAGVIGRAGQGAALGAGFGAAAPVTSDDYWGTKAAQVGTGAVIGGLIPPAIDAAKVGYKVGRNLIDPMLPGGTDRAAARLLAEAAGPKRAAIEAELAKNQQFVAGSQPTAAEAAAPAGSPGFSALQRFAESRKPDVYADIAAKQAGERSGAIKEFGQTPLELKAAEVLRARTAAQNYGASAKDVVFPGDGKIAALFERPSISEALKRAKSLVEEAGGTFGSKTSGYTVADMQAVKMALDDIVKDPKTFGIGASEANAIQKTRGEFINWLSNESPKWDLARRVYAAQSKPINEMQVGQELEKALGKPIGVGERPGVFAGAMQEAPRTLKRATGQPRFEELDEVLSPDNLAKAKGVLADLSRKAEQERLAGLGAHKISELEKPFGLPATGPLHQGYMVFKTILGRVSKGITDKVLDDVADALQLPSATLKLMQKLPDEQKQQMIESLLVQKFGRGAIVAGTTAASQGGQQ